MTTEHQEIGIVRRCRRCDRWQSIEHFDELGKLCKACCSHKGTANRRIAHMRGIVLTPKARAYLNEGRSAAA
jgi:hypothetical protein